MVPTAGLFSSLGVAGLSIMATGVGRLSPVRLLPAVYLVQGR